MTERVRRFELVLTDTDEVVGDGAWFAVDESVAVAYRGGRTCLYPDGLDAVVCPHGRLANHVRWRES